MSINLDGVRSRAKQLAPAFSQAPIFRADLRSADPSTILSVILVLLGRDVMTAKAIKAYLSKRGAAYDDETIQFLLDTFHGGDRRHHLWQLTERGEYYSLL